MRAAVMWCREKRESLLFSVLVNMVILAFLLAVFRPFYESNDDMSMALLVNGGRGTYDAHLMSANYTLGLILSVLYRMNNRIPWYSLLQYALLFCSYTAIYYVVMRRLKTSSGLWISLIVLWFFAYEGYVRPQYTKTAGIATAAGILLLLAAAECGRGVWRKLLSGYVIACVGFMYRPEQFAAVFALMSGIGVFLLLEKVGEKERLRKFLLRCSGIFGALVLLAAGMFGADLLAYRSPEWRDYMEYNDLRSELFDYGFPDFKQNKAAYKALGIDRTAYRMYRSWNHVDTEKFTPEIMRELIAWKTPKKINVRFVTDFMKKMFSGLYTRNCFLCFLLVLFVRLCRGGFTKSSVVTIVYELALVMVIYFCLYYAGRFLLNRVDVSLWLAVVLVLLWTFPEGSRRLAGHMELVLLFAVLCLTQYAWRGAWRSSTEGRAEAVQSMQSAVETVHADGEHLYLVKMGTLTFSGGYGVFEQVPFDISGNVLALGGWTTMMPWYRGLMAKWGVTNPFRDLIGNEKLCLVDNDIDGTLKYLRKYYDRSAEAVLVREFPNFNVYQITSGKEK